MFLIECDVLIDSRTSETSSQLCTTKRRNIRIWQEKKDDTVSIGVIVYLNHLNPTHNFSTSFRGIRTGADIFPFHDMFLMDISNVLLGTYLSLFFSSIHPKTLCFSLINCEKSFLFLLSAWHVSRH
jgi:hypothetical protein